jgi:hypothetical protein
MSNMKKVAIAKKSIVAAKYTKKTTVKEPVVKNIKKTPLPNFRGATLALYNLLKGGKSFTYAQLLKFKKDNQLKGTYSYLRRLRKIGLRTRQFTIVPTGDTLPTRSYKLVQGVTKDSTWTKALPTRSEKPAKAKKSTKKVVAKKSTKKAAPAKKVVAKKIVKKVTSKKVTPRKPVLVGADDDEALEA